MFILFYAIVNGIVVLISLKDCSFLLQRNTTDVYVLILYPATLLDSFISYNIFGWTFLDFLHIRLCHLQIKIVLFLSFQSA